MARTQDGRGDPRSQRPAAESSQPRRWPRTAAARSSVLCCLLALACGGRDGRVMLGLQYREGATQRLGLQTQVDVNLTVGDRQIPVSLGWDLDLEIVVNHVDAAGVADITAYIDSFDLSRRGGPAFGRDQGSLRYFHALVN